VLVVAEDHPFVLAELVVALASGPGYQLGDAVTRSQPLQVVVMAVDDELRVAP
jgi:hypothetical protein